MSVSSVLGCVLVTLVLPALAGSAFARPVDRTQLPEKLKFMDLTGAAKEFLDSGDPGVLAGATAGTVWFGGTVWAADSNRWEALGPGDVNQVWTFESGVGSYIKTQAVGTPVPGDPEVNPFKAPGLHARMEGWFGIDNTYRSLGYFRRCTSGSPANTEGGIHDWEGGVCVGAPAGLGGSWSMWAGAFKDEADALCWGGGQGYGNNWLVCIEHDFPYTGGGVNLSFAYKNDSEPDYDYTYVYVDTSGGGPPKEVIAAQFDGIRSSAETTIVLAPGFTLPRLAKPIKIKFCSTSDSGWSDRDGFYATACGSFAVDNVTVTGGGNAYFTDFEEDAGGWVLSPPVAGPGGEWSDLYHLSALPPMLARCSCALYDTVLAFPDPSGGHPSFADNMAISPWCDLKGAGLVGAPGKILRTNLYTQLALLNYTFVWTRWQYFPYICPSTGRQILSSWRSPTIYYYFGEVPVCTSTAVGNRGTQFNMQGVPASAEKVRIALGVINTCPYNRDCIPVTNSTPYFDNAAVGVYGTPGAPSIFVDVFDTPQDNFPEDGTLGINSAGRVDCNNVDVGQPEVGSSLGDTLIIQGAVGNSEMWVHFRVDPGPGTAANPAYATWYNSHPASVFEAGFKMARCDSSERGRSGPSSGFWMTAYHELDPSHGKAAVPPVTEPWDRELDPTDLAPGGGNYRLKHDIFPDNLFTPGTRLDLFYTANYRPNPAVDDGQPNTPFVRAPLTDYYEMEIMPSSMDGTGKFNCVLYVDHYNRGAQGYITNALNTILGTGSANFEGTNHDRFDVNAESSQQMSFGRPLQTEYGATVPQALGYKVIFWSTGDLDSFCLTREDADVLTPYLTLQGFSNRNLFLDGEGAASAPLLEAISEPSAGGPNGLIQKIVGVKLDANCAAGSFRLAGCDDAPEGEALELCVALNPLGSTVGDNGGGRTEDHVAWGNGCPNLGSFNVFQLNHIVNFGSSVGDEIYATPTKTADFASVYNDGSTGPNTQGFSYKTVVDGTSVHMRRDADGPCDFTTGATNSVTERIREVFRFFGINSKAILRCEAPTGSTDIPGDESQEPKFRTSLADFAPNPLVHGAAGRIRFTMAREGRATIDIFDIEGRLVKSVFQSVAKEGPNEAFWNGTNESGTQVASGVYFYRLRTADEDLSKRMVVVRDGGS